MVADASGAGAYDPRLVAELTREEFLLVAVAQPPAGVMPLAERPRESVQGARFIGLAEGHCSQQLRRAS